MAEDAVKRSLNYKEIYLYFYNGRRSQGIQY